MTARDARGRGPRPRLFGDVAVRFRDSVAPETALAAVQSAWTSVVGAEIEAVTTVVGEREGVVTVECENAVWVQELSLMEPRLRKRLKEVLGDAAPAELRFQVNS